MVSCTAVPGPPAIFLPSRSAGLRMPDHLAGDHGERGLVEAHIDGDQRRGRIRALNRTIEGMSTQPN